MKNYDVYFEIYGKRMKTTVFAENEGAAKEKIKSKIIFHKVVLKPNDEFNEIDNILNKMNDFFQGKK